MSVECGLFLVDWSEFGAAVAGRREVYPALRRRRAEPLPTTSVAAQGRFLTCLDALPAQAPELAGPVSAAREVFGHLFWGWRGAEFRVVDLAGTPGPVGLESAWSPETTRRFGRVAEGADLSPARRWFRPDPSGWFAEFDQFIGYGEAWLGAVRLGAASGRGLVVVVYG